MDSKNRPNEDQQPPLIEDHPNSATTKCIIIGIVWFFLLTVVPFIILTFVYPKFEIRFADMFGDDGGGLPEITELALNMRVKIYDKSIFTIPIGLLLGHAAATSLGSKVF